MTDTERQAVLKVAVPLPLPALFDYLPPEGGSWPMPGQRVLVRFGQRKLVGLVAGSAPGSEVPRQRLQQVLQALDDGRAVMPGNLLRLLLWCADYYKHPVGEVMFNALPPELRKAAGSLAEPPLVHRLTDAGRLALAQPSGRAPVQHRLLACLASGAMNAAALRLEMPEAARVLRAVTDKGWVEAVPAEAEPARPVAGPPLTPEQRSVLDGLQSGLQGFQCHLLDGITGSGKTEIYLRLLAEVLAAGRQALVLVPEIGLTPQLVRRFRERLGITPVVSHSGLSSGERMQAWSAALRGDARLLLGTRSALFLPLCRPGIIIMDESHDPSFKQQDGFRFSARDVAIMRARELGIPILLGTATPSLETLHNAQSGRYRWHRLRQRATGAAEPEWRLVDLRQQPIAAGLSPPALTAVAETLERGEQVLVFLNRRGYAPVLLCHACGWHAGCPRCDANLTWHRSGNRLVCHHCDHRQLVPALCPDCSADALQGAGEGTEQLEQWLARQFEDYPMHRVDRDRVRRKGELEAIVAAVHDGQPCLMVGTQMLAKGHHFPKVTLVVVVNLDQALYSADFRALERMGQTLVQVAGRAGREAHPGTVILQTHHPEHPSLTLLIRSGYEAFARDQLRERELAGLPPYSYQAVLRAEAGERDAVLAFLNRAAQCGDLRPRPHGPFPAMMERRGGRLRWYLLVQDHSRSALQSMLDRWLPLVRDMPEARRVRWTVDVDPQEF